MKKIFYIYYKRLKFKKRKYFFQFYIKTLKVSNIERKNKENIHNRLYFDSKKRLELIRELEQKIYQNEGDICTFSPKINNNSSINSSNPYLEKYDRKIGQDWLANKYINNYSSSNLNKRKVSKNNIINKTKSVKVLKQSTNINQLFNEINENHKQINKSQKNIDKDINNYKFLEILNDYYTLNHKIQRNDKDNNNYNNNKESNSNFINNKKRNNNITYYNNFFVSNNRDMNNQEKNNLNNFHKKYLNNSKQNINKNKIYFNNLNKINSIEIENNNKENGIIKLNKKPKRNRIFDKDNKFELKNNKSNIKNNKFFSINTSVSSNILKRNQSNIISSKTDYQKININQSKINQNKFDLLKYKNIANQNKKNIVKIQHKKDKDDNSALNLSKENDKKEKEKNGEKGKIDCLQKNNSNLSCFKHSIDIFSINEKTRFEIKKSKPNKNKNISLTKGNKSLSSIKINKDKSYSFINSSLSRIKNDIKNKSHINIIDDIFNLNCIKRNIKNFKKEYFYTFRNRKEPYKSFNYLYNMHSMTNTNKINIKMKGKDEFKNSNKNSFLKNYTRLSNIEKPKDKINLKRIYNLYNKINSIYSNEFEKNNLLINKINKYKNDNHNTKKKYFTNKNIAFDFSKIRPSLNTNKTNYDTKGYSSASLSTKDIKYITNSKRESKGNNSIQNKKYFIQEIKKSNIHSSKENYANNIKINKKDELKNNKISESQQLKIDSKVENVFFNNNNQKDKISNKGDSIIKLERSMTLQSISDSKMLELAEHYIDTKNDCLDDIGVKKIIFKKPIENSNKI